jgi:hypothetical protein
VTTRGMYPNAGVSVRVNVRVIVVEAPDASEAAVPPGVVEGGLEITGGHRFLYGLPAGDSEVVVPSPFVKVHPETSESRTKPTKFIVSAVLVLVIRMVCCQTCVARL